MRKVASWSSLFGITLGLICASNADAADTPASATSRHALWTVKGKQNTVYLLGSVHFLSPLEELPKVVDAAYKDAESLLMEIDLDDLDPTEVQQVASELGMLPPSTTLAQEIGQEAYDKLVPKVRAVNLEPEMISHFRPWFAAMLLAQQQLARMGLDPNSGVEQRLVQRAAVDKKPIKGLETLRQQLEMLANLPKNMQREFLLYTVEDTDRATKEIQQLLTAWRSGNTEELERLLSEGFDKYPELYKPLTADRNRRWLTQITDLLDDRDDYLVVVGTLHLVGKDSVIDLLEQKGYKATQH